MPPPILICYNVVKINERGIKMKDIAIRPVRPDEIDKIADLISTGYYNDIFFKWVVENDDHRHKIVTDYYKAYLNARGCVAHAAETPSGEIIGASVWLPHDTDASVYDAIDAAAGIYAKNFRAVADWSHLSEPPMAPFYQLVGFVIGAQAKGKGLGVTLLKHNLELFDKMGIPTYLEASTPYHGGGVYGKFGYQPVGELMFFTDTAVLYPLWRPAKRKLQIDFGGYNWHVLETGDDRVLLLSEKIIELGRYHDTYENVAWSISDMRRYLNNGFYNKFKPHEQSQILETALFTDGNPWFAAGGGTDAATDKIFLLSIEEAVKYFGDSGQLKNPIGKFFIDDDFNDARKAVCTDNSPGRWFLRTPGSSNNFVSVVTIEGKISVTGDFVNRSGSELFNVGIRPAVWVKKEGISMP